jgi:hypothetical protein
MYSVTNSPVQTHEIILNQNTHFTPLPGAQANPYKLRYRGILDDRRPELYLAGLDPGSGIL